MLLTAVLMRAAEGGLTAFNPETGTTSQGETVASGQPLMTTFEVEVGG